MLSNIILYRHHLRSVVIVSLILFSTSCTKYWWTRGQPPNTKTLVERSQERLDQVLAEKGSLRPSTAKIATELKNSLSTSYQLTRSQPQQTLTKLTEELKHARNLFLDLETELSVGSRAPYGELSGQLRVFVAKSEQGEKVLPETLGLFSARTFFFLANELEVPQPVS